MAQRPPLELPEQPPADLADRRGLAIQPPPALAPPNNPILQPTQLEQIAKDSNQRFAAAKAAEKKAMRNDAALGATMSAAAVYRQTKRRQLQDAQRQRNARELFSGGLPDADTTLHCITNGTFNYWDIVPTVISKAGGVCRQLDIATLGFNRRNMHGLLELIDGGQVERVQLVCSVLHERLERKNCQWLWEQLAARGSVLRVGRNHAKVFLFEMESGAAYVVEGSANLRSCEMAEQFIVAQSPELLRFHRGWLDELVEAERIRRRDKPEPDKHVIQ